MMVEWQPIETAPRDGTEIIGAFCNDYGYMDKPTVYGPWTCAFRKGRWMASWDDTHVIESESYAGTEYKGTDIDPTHWQPIPEPPS